MKRTNSLFRNQPCLAYFIEQSSNGIPGPQVIIFSQTVPYHTKKAIWLRYLNDYHVFLGRYRVWLAISPRLKCISTDLAYSNCYRMNHPVVGSNSQFRSLNKQKEHGVGTPCSSLFSRLSQRSTADSYRRCRSAPPISTSDPAMWLIS